ncbi:hypothetical protein M514_02774 [Trichuris suis]|uniref:Uncharacterized protein n=1 Tax=Trichuris suis TaxID=68888 RepID=A0A085MGH3_9BILA|nr:hypothetical protein M513_02774 [Trichuris suis]KFD68748.1 hypothetical protein M514_02774 [Trichuris suis]
MIGDHGRTTALFKAKLQATSSFKNSLFEEHLMNQLQQHVICCRALASSTQKIVLERKFNSLGNRQAWEFNRSPRTAFNSTLALDELLFNLSSSTLSDFQQMVLSEGLDLMPSLQTPAYSGFGRAYRTQPRFN